MFPLGVSFHIEHPVEDSTTYVTRDPSKTAMISNYVDENNAGRRNGTYFFRVGFREPLPRGRGGGVGMLTVSVRIMPHTVWQNSGNVLSKTSWILNCQSNSTTQFTG